MNTLRLIAALAACALSTAAPTVHAQASCDTQDVIPLGPPVEGTGMLCVTRAGLYGRLNVASLDPGSAYTVWWVYFDDPASCVVPFQCGDADFVGDNPLAVFGRMDSVIAPNSGSAVFSGRLRGLTPTSGAQIWLLMFGHGPADFADGRHLARQLLTPEDPNTGAPHLGNWIDGVLGFPAALAVFVAD